MHAFDLTFSIIHFFNWSYRVWSYVWRSCSSIHFIIDNIPCPAMYKLVFIWEIWIIFFPWSLCMIVSFLVFHSLIEVFQGFVVVCFFTKFFKSYGYQVLKLIEVGLDIVHNGFVELWKCFKLRGDDSALCHHHRVFINKIFGFVLSVRIHPILDPRKCRESVISIQFMDTISV